MSVPLGNTEVDRLVRELDGIPAAACDGKCGGVCTDCPNDQGELRLNAAADPVAGLRNGIERACACGQDPSECAHPNCHVIGDKSFQLADPETDGPHE